MKKYISLSSLQLILVLSVFGQDYKFPLSISANQRYLVDYNNKPFFYNGDTGWKIYVKLNKAEVIEYLTDRKNKRFTAIQTILTGFKNDTSVFGHRPFKNLNDFSTVNHSYFDHVDWVIRQADSLGLLIAIAPMWAGCCGEGYGGKGEVAPTSTMDTNGEAKTRAFGEYIGKRFAKYNNILWIIGGDIDPYEDRANMNQLALGIKSKAPHQLMTYHASSGHSSTDVWKNASWLDVAMTYTYFRGFETVWNKDQPDVYEVNYREFAKTPIKPFFLGESTYEGEHGELGSALRARKQAYWSALSGGNGNCYGTPMWSFNKNWRSSLNLPGGNSMQHYFNLFQVRPWFQIVPDPLSKIIKKGARTFGYNDYAVAGADQNGEFIIAYIPSGRSLSVSASALKSRKMKASWYNPRDGAWKSIGTYESSEVVSFDTPDQNDWVLVLDSSK